MEFKVHTINIGIKEYIYIPFIIYVFLEMLV